MRGRRVKFSDFAVRVFFQTERQISSRTLGRLVQGLQSPSGGPPPWRGRSSFSHRRVAGSQRRADLRRCAADANPSLPAGVATIRMYPSSRPNCKHCCCNQKHSGLVAGGHKLNMRIQSAPSGALHLPPASSRIAAAAVYGADDAITQSMAGYDCSVLRLLSHWTGKKCLFKTSLGQIWVSSSAWKFKAVGWPIRRSPPGVQVAIKTLWCLEKHFLFLFFLLSVCPVSLKSSKRLVQGRLHPASRQPRASEGRSSRPLWKPRTWLGFEIDLQ